MLAGPQKKYISFECPTHRKRVCWPYLSTYNKLDHIALYGFLRHCFRANVTCSVAPLVFGAATTRLLQLHHLLKKSTHRRLTVQIGGFECRGQSEAAAMPSRETLCSERCLERPTDGKSVSHTDEGHVLSTAMSNEWTAVQFGCFRCGDQDQVATMPRCSC